MSKNLSKQARQQWWRELSPEDKSLYQQKWEKGKPRKQPYKFPAGTELTLTPAIKRRVTKNMKRLGLESQMVW